MQEWTNPRRVVAVVLVALCAWSGSILRGGFAFDDREVVLENPVVAGALPWTEAFRRDYMHHLGDAGQYRPLVTLSLRLDHALWGETAWGYHLTNVLLHLAVVALAGCVLVRLEVEQLGVLGLLCFAVHPVLADSVAWIAGRMSMLSALGGLVGLWLVARSRGTRGAFLGGLALLLGLLCKEDAIVFAPVCAALAFRRSRRRGVAAASGLAVALALYLVLRAWALTQVWPEAVHAPLSAVPLGERLLYGGRGVLEGLRLCVFPFGYPPNYRAVPGFTPATLPSAFAWSGVVVLFAAVALGASRRASLERASVALAACAFVPFLHVLPVGEVFAPRFLYLPLLMAVPALDALLRRLPHALVFVLLIGAIVLAWQRAGVYASRASYAESVIARVPEDARSWNDLGLAHEEDGDLEQARAAWEHAHELDASYGRPLSNLARLALETGDLDEAERLLRQATELGRANPTAYCNLGAVLLRQNNPGDAIAAYERATKLAPGLAAAWRGLGNALMRAGMPEQAERALGRALALDPEDPSARRLRERLDD